MTSLVVRESGGGTSTVYESGTAVTMFAQQLLWSGLTGGSGYTISPIGTSTAGIVSQNNGADYGPDTVVSGTQTVTSGIQEWFNATPSGAPVGSTLSIPGALLPGKFLLNSPVVFSSYPMNNSQPFLVGCGYNQTDIASGSGWGTQTAILMWQLWATVIAGTLNTGGNPAAATYLGHFGWDYNGHSSTYGVLMGYPGGYSADIASAAFMVERLAGRGSGLIGTACVWSSVEDGMVLQTAPAGPCEWIVTNGSAKVIGGNMNAFNASSAHFEFTDSVLTQVTTGCNGAGFTSKTPSKLSIVGAGFNGVNGSCIQVNLGSDIVVIKTIGIDWGQSGSLASNLGLIGTIGTGTLPPIIVSISGGQFSPLSNNGILGNGVTAYVYCDNVFCTGPNSVVSPQPYFINGTMFKQVGGTIYPYINGFLQPVGKIATPFGTFSPFAVGPINAIGPGVTSGSSVPVSNVTYTVVNDTLDVISTGGTVSITILDGNGGTVVSGLSSLPYPGAILFPGWQINFGTVSANPTVTVVGQ